MKTGTAMGVVSEAVDKIEEKSRSVIMARTMETQKKVFVKRLERK